MTKEVSSARYDLLKYIKESEVVKEVQAVIDATGLQVQRINTGAFATGTGAIADLLEVPKKAP